MLINLNCSNSLALILQGIVATTILGGATTVGCTDDRAKDESRPTRPVSLSADVSPRHAELVAGAYTHLASAEREPAKVDAYRILAGQTFEKAYRVYGRRGRCRKGSLCVRIGGEKKCAFVRQAAALRAEAAILLSRSMRFAPAVFRTPRSRAFFRHWELEGVRRASGVNMARYHVFSCGHCGRSTVLRATKRRRNSSVSPRSSSRKSALRDPRRWPLGVDSISRVPAGTELRWSTRAPKVNKSVFALCRPVSLGHRFFSRSKFGAQASRPDFKSCARSRSRRKRSGRHRADRSSRKRRDA